MKSTDQQQAKLLQRVPTVTLMLRDEQFRAIGHMAVQWAFLEAEIDRELVWLNKQSEHKDHPVKLGAKFEDRTERWREMATLTYQGHPKCMEAVESISTKAVEIKVERDKIIHGNFGSSGIFFRIRHGRCIEVSDTVGTAPHIEDLACRISDVTAALFKHQAELGKAFDMPLG
jgi:hypothetical protein